jgi:hypothetical protein
MIFRAAAAMLFSGFAVLMATAMALVQIAPVAAQAEVSTTSPFMPNGQWAVAAAMLTTDLPRGTVYKAGGIARTARHVSEYTRLVGLPGTFFKADVTCKDTSTDSATLETEAPLFDFPVGSIPKVGDVVIAAGFKGGKYPPTIVRSRVSAFYKVLMAGEDPANLTPVGPAFSFDFAGSARGMSGGPVFVNGKVVGTITLSDGERIFAVPLTAAKCQAP